jgi:hypothetical protein
MAGIISKETVEKLRKAFYNEDEVAFNAVLPEVHRLFSESVLPLPEGWLPNRGVISLDSLPSHFSQVRILTTNMDLSDGRADNYRWTLGRFDDIVAYKVL